MWPPLGILLVHVRTPPLRRGLMLLVPLGVALDTLRGLELLLRLPPVRRWLQQRVPRGLALPLPARLAPWTLIRAGGELLERLRAEAPFTLAEIETEEATVRVRVI